MSFHTFCTVSEVGRRILALNPPQTNRLYVLLKWCDTFRMHPHDKLNLRRNIKRLHRYYRHEAAISKGMIELKPIDFSGVYAEDTEIGIRMHFPSGASMQFGKRGQR